MATQTGTVEAYLRGYPQDVQDILEEIRRRSGVIVPEAGEKISYQMPTVTMEGRALVYYATKDRVMFTYRKPIPYALIVDVVALLVRRRWESENDPVQGNR